MFATPKSANVDINDVANFFLRFAHEHGDYLTNLKIQKLAYYAQAWYLAFYDAPLCDERFEAWVHGPVNPNLYNRFKSFGWRPITCDAEVPQLEDEVVEHLEEVMEVFGSHTAHDLELMTHGEPPWIIARGSLPLDAPSCNAIKEVDMREFYKSLLS